jgi:large subunit ribosomal protein L29
VRVHEVRELSDEDLAQELEGSYKELLNVRFRLATKQMSNTSQLRIVRRNIARLNTVTHERQLGRR